jgi:hypothetical protein
MRQAKELRVEADQGNRQSADPRVSEGDFPAASAFLPVLSNLLGVRIGSN